MPPSKIMVIRHAEKPDKSAGAMGVREDGKHDPDSLTVRGWQRAGALVTLFGPGGGPVRSGLATPDCVFASSPGTSSSERPEETVSVLVAKLRETNRSLVTVFTHEKGSELAMVADVMKRSGVVLISWQHEFIPGIGSIIFRNGSSCPQTWPAERFDLVWTFDHQADGSWRFIQVPQLLLAGDRMDVIA